MNFKAPFNQPEAAWIKDDGLLATADYVSVSKDGQKKERGESDEWTDTGGPRQTEGAGALPLTEEK